MNYMPRLFVPGFPKAGTTSICAALGEHPAVFAPYTKEPHHWATDLAFYAAREGTTKRSAYMSLYDRMDDTHIYGLDGSTLYLYSEYAISKIVAAVPDPRFIVCVREVRSIIAAWHGQMIAGGYEDLKSLNDAWLASRERRAGKRVPSGCPDAKLLDYERIGLQGEQMERLLKYVPRSAVLVVHLNDLSDDSASVVSHCLTFLGLDENETISIKPRNSAFTVRHRWLRRLLYAPSVKRMTNRVLNRLGPVFASSMREIARRVVYRTSTRTVPDEATLEAIDIHFSSDQILLRALLADLPSTYKTGATRHDSLV